MNIFAIGDLHLSGSVNKPMHVFGPAWEQHDVRIAAAWRDTVRESDIVLLPGDFSWAMRGEEVRADLEYLHALPGKKVMIRGNHDYWWNSPSKVRAMLPPSVYIVQNDCVTIEGVHIGGTRGWTCPGSAGFTENDEKLYNREVGRLSLSLKAMPTCGLRIVMLHYPPFNEKRENSGFSERVEAEKIDIVVYGHLHGRSCRGAFEGMRNGTEYFLTSADYLHFCPKLIREV
ncbi:metallophosphoesterase [Christensenellaceae bacterium OttesenSCG-928-L17]|nr:metallophosphoesterase [Christensenellaceae bacterium OttesenSCG-928-L17]